MVGPSLLLLAGVLGGAMNAMAGGGSFVTLPALIAAGVPSTIANATSTAALWPSSAASTWVYRTGLRAIGGVPLRPTFVVTVAGGLVGALLLLRTPSGMFDRVLPWLLLVATIALAFGPRLGPMLRVRFRVGLVTVLGVQFLLGIYGGYFGGAVGLMMVAVWGLLDGADIAGFQGPRTLLVTAANSVAVLCFAIAGTVAWWPALLLGAGALAGGFAGAQVGRRLPSTATRIATIALTAVVTIRFFLRAYG